MKKILAVIHILSLHVLLPLYVGISPKEVRSNQQR